MSWMDLLRGSFGIAALIGFAYLISENRRAVPWRIIATGIGLQLIVAFAVLRVEPIYNIFDSVSDFFVALMAFSGEGAAFLFGNLMDVNSFGFIFAFQVLPTIVFFSALTSLLYYLNILQYIVYGFAWVMHRTMRLSGAESLATAANIFIGQTEAPLVVKPYLEKMTRSEIMALMSGGMATIAGAVLVAYMGLLGGGDPERAAYFATHLLVASIISAPAALMMAKCILPETEAVDRELLIPRHRMGENVIDAVTRGTTEGVKLAANVAAMLLVFTAMIAMVNYILREWIGDWTQLNDQILNVTNGRYDGLTLQFVLGLLLAPVAWLLGVPYGDLMVVGQLLGEKTILNEFYAYVSFSQLKEAGVLVNERSIIIATYALCGFANVASIGIQVGGISAIAPGQRTNLAQLGFKAMIAGTLAAFITACIAGMLVRV